MIRLSANSCLWGSGGHVWEYSHASPCYSLALQPSQRIAALMPPICAYILTYDKIPASWQNGHAVKMLRWACARCGGHGVHLHLFQLPGKFCSIHIGSVASLVPTLRSLICYRICTLRLMTDPNAHSVPLKAHNTPDSGAAPSPLLCHSDPLLLF